MAMLGIELIIIYLAIGAPFGVNRGWQERPAFSLSAAIRAALLWPVAAFQGLACWRKQKRAAGEAVKHFGPEHQAQRDALAALTELSRALYPIVSTATAGQLWIQGRDALDKYTGLTATVNNLDENAELSPRASEIFRLEGLTGQDLQRAGRCVQRRNATRLRAHQIQARQELLEALSQAQQTVNTATTDVRVKDLWQGFMEKARQLCLVLGDTETTQEVTLLLGEDKHTSTVIDVNLTSLCSTVTGDFLPKSNLPAQPIAGDFISSFR
jgi:hypothetical protein